MTIQLEVKAGFYKELIINFPASSQSAYEQALESLEIENPEVNNSDTVISPEQFQDKCKEQPEEGVLYLPNGFTADKIAGILKSENPRETIKNYLKPNNIGRDALGGLDRIAQQQKEEREIEQEFENFKQDLEENGNKVKEENISQKDLKKWVKDCDRALLDNILASYENKEGVEASALSTKRKKVVELVVEQRDAQVASLIKLSYNKASAFISEINSTKKELETAKEVYDDKREDHNQAKQSLQSSHEYVAMMSDMLIVQDNVNASEMLGREQTKRNILKAKKIRNRIKREGLVSLAKGVAMATIEGKADAYIATANKVSCSEN